MKGERQMKRERHTHKISDCSLTRNGELSLSCSFLNNNICVRILTGEVSVSHEQRLKHMCSCIARGGSQVEAGCGCTGPNLFNCELIFDCQKG